MWTLVSSSVAWMTETSFQSSAVVEGRALRKSIVIFSVAIGMPSGVRFSSGFSICSRVSTSSLSPPQEARTAVEARAAPEARAARRVKGVRDMLRVSFRGYDRFGGVGMVRGRCDAGTRRRLRGGR